MDIPIIIKKAEVGYNDNDDVSGWNTIFSGFVNPLSFNQPFALRWNEFELECIDKLGVLEYKLFPDLLKDEQGNMNKSYKTPREFIKLALEKVVEFSGINYSIDYDELNGTKIDHTTDTKINPQIFIGDSKDDWMTCKEALEEIGKIYGCFFWQDGDIKCKKWLGKVFNYR